MGPIIGAGESTLKMETMSRNRCQGEETGTSIYNTITTGMNIRYYMILLRMGCDANATIIGI
jgi:hypothetical protein